jgi:hypothetical protein
VYKLSYGESEMKIPKSTEPLAFHEKIEGISELIREYQELGLEWGASYVLRAWYYYKLGDHAASVSDLSRAWSIDKEGTLSMLTRAKRKKRRSVAVLADVEKMITTFENDGYDLPFDRKDIEGFWEKEIANSAGQV